jgi:hypothetical protein
MRDGSLVESEGRLLTAKTIAPGIGPQQQAIQMLNHLASLRHARQRHASPVAGELSLRLLSRVSNLESTQTRPTPAQYATMTSTSAAHHTTGAIRWQLNLDRDGRKPSLANSWSRVTQLAAPMKTKQGHSYRSRNSNNTAATAAELMRMRRDRDFAVARPE